MEMIGLQQDKCLEGFDMGKFGGNRNFGFGKQMAFAGTQAIKDRFVAGHFASVATHAARWAQFAQWLKDNGIRDARDITKAVIEDYGKYLKGHVLEDEMKVAYAQNLLSTVNVILSQMRGDKKMDVSPADLVGKRSTIRVDVPIWMNRDAVHQVYSNLMNRGHVREAAMVDVARYLGLRFRETCLLDAKAAYREALRTQKVTISKGVKGGNNTRVVPIADPRQLEALRSAAEAQGNQKNMMGEDRNYIQHRNHAYKMFYSAEGKHFHDLRASYACDRYQQLTGHLAPVLRGEGDPRPSRDIDRSARAIISQELGHARVEVVSEYIGGRR